MKTSLCRTVPGPRCWLLMCKYTGFVVVVNVDMINIFKSTNASIPTMLLMQHCGMEVVRFNQKINNNQDRVLINFPKRIILPSHFRPSGQK